MHAILAFPQDPFTQSTQLKNKQIALSWAQNLCNKGNILAHFGSSEQCYESLSGRAVYSLPSEDTGWHPDLCLSTLSSFPLAGCGCDGGICSSHSDSGVTLRMQAPSWSSNMEVLCFPQTIWSTVSAPAPCWERELSMSLIPFFFRVHSLN